MDEMWFRMFGMSGMTGGSVMDLTAIIAFIAFAVIYLLVPLLGGQGERPMALLTSLYLLIGYGGVSLVQTLVLWMQMLDRGGNGNSIGHITFGFMVLKMALFLIALVVFVSGLRAVRLREHHEERHED